MTLPYTASTRQSRISDLFRKVGVREGVKSGRKESTNYTLNLANNRNDFGKRRIGTTY